MMNSYLPAMMPDCVLSMWTFDEPALPLWLVVPIAAAVMLMLAGHVIALREVEDIPEGRRRIRIAGSVVGLMLTPQVVYLFSIATTNDPRTFAMVWMSVICMLTAIVLIAIVDAVYTARLTICTQRLLAEEIRQAQARIYAMGEPVKPVQLRLTSHEGDDD